MEYGIVVDHSEANHLNPPDPGPVTVTATSVTGEQQRHTDLDSRQAKQLLVDYRALGGWDVDVTWQPQPAPTEVGLLGIMCPGCRLDHAADEQAGRMPRPVLPANRCRRRHSR